MLSVSRRCDGEPESRMRPTARYASTDWWTTFPLKFRCALRCALQSHIGALQARVCVVLRTVAWYANSDKRLCATNVPLTTIGAIDLHRAIDAAHAATSRPFRWCADTGRLCDNPA